MVDRGSVLIVALFLSSYFDAVYARRLIYALRDDFLRFHSLDIEMPSFVEKPADDVKMST